jgi:hypothetical protein
MEIFNVKIRECFFTSELHCQDVCQKCEGIKNKMDSWRFSASVILLNNKENLRGSNFQHVQWHQTTSDNFLAS